MDSVRQCVILLGGLGTRLGSLTRETPKPMLAVGGRPFVEVLIWEAVRRGFCKILLLAGFRSEVVAARIEQWNASLPDSCRVELSVEPEPLGTGGALIHARDMLDDRFLLLNGDTWFDFNWLDLVKLAGDQVAVAAREVAVAAGSERFPVHQARFGSAALIWSQVATDGDSRAWFTRGRSLVRSQPRPLVLSR